MRGSADPTSNSRNPSMDARDGRLCLANPALRHPGIEPRRRHLEAGKLEPWCHGAANERPGPEALRLLPGVRRNHRLWAFSRCEVDAEPRVAAPGGIGNRQQQRRAGVPVPDLGRIDAMPARNLAGLEQEVDRRRVGPPQRPAHRISERLAVMPALRMRLQAEQTDDVVDGGVACGPIHVPEPVCLLLLANAISIAPLSASSVPYRMHMPPLGSAVARTPTMIAPPPPCKPHSPSRRRRWCRSC